MFLNVLFLIVSVCCAGLQVLLWCLVEVIIVGWLVIVSGFVCCLLFKGVHQGALFFVVFRVWLNEDFEGIGFCSLRGKGAEQFWSCTSCIWVEMFVVQAFRCCFGGLWRLLLWGGLLL